MRTLGALMRWLHYFAGLICLAMTAGKVAAEGHTLPELLRMAAAEKGCAEIDKFFDRPGLVDPPFVLGYLPGDRESSAAFWCARPIGQEKYLLVIVGKSNKCPSEISWQNYPGGLSVIRDTKMALSSFFYRDNVREKGPAAAYTRGPVLRSEYDGTGEYFYCYEGRWLVRQSH